MATERGQSANSVFHTHLAVHEQISAESICCLVLSPWVHLAFWSKREPKKLKVMSSGALSALVEQAMTVERT